MRPFRFAGRKIHSPGIPSLFQVEKRGKPEEKPENQPGKLKNQGNLGRVHGKSGWKAPPPEARPSVYFGQTDPPISE